jgi:hypothetical protein
VTERKWLGETLPYEPERAVIASPQDSKRGDGAKQQEHMSRALVSATSRRDFISKDSQDVKHLMVSPPQNCSVRFSYSIGDENILASAVIALAFLQKRHPAPICNRPKLVWLGLQNSISCSVLRAIEENRRCIDNRDRSTCRPGRDGRKAKRLQAMMEEALKTEHDFKGRKLTIGPLDRSHRRSIAEESRCDETQGGILVLVRR